MHCFCLCTPRRPHTIIFFLLICLTFWPNVSARSATGRRQFVEINRHRPPATAETDQQNQNVASTESNDSKTMAKAKGHKSANAEESHCWIRVDRRGKTFDVHGTCFELSKGMFACQSKLLVDPFNIYCKFLDR